MNPIIHKRWSLISRYYWSLVGVFCFVICSHFNPLPDCLKYSIVRCWARTAILRFIVDFLVQLAVQRQHVAQKIHSRCVRREVWSLFYLPEFPSTVWRWFSFVKRMHPMKCYANFR